MCCLSLIDGPARQGMSDGLSEEAQGSEEAGLREKTGQEETAEASLISWNCPGPATSFWPRPGGQGSAQARLARVVRGWRLSGLYQRSWILTPFTVEISFAHQARFAPWCRATTSGPQRRERTRDRGLRWGKSARRVRCGACPMPRIAPRAAPTRACQFAAMKWVNIHDLWYYSSGEALPDLRATGSWPGCFGVQVAASSDGRSRIFSKP